MNRFQIHFDPERARTRVDHRLRALLFGPGFPLTFDLLSVALLVLTGGVALLLARTVFRDAVGSGGLAVTVVVLVIMAIYVLVGLVCGGLRFWRYRRAVVERRMVKEGLALVIDDRGIQTEDAFYLWDQIRVVRVEDRGFGWDWHLVVDAESGQARFPLYSLDATPANLDLIVRASSVNRFGIDLRPIDRRVAPRVEGTVGGSGSVPAPTTG